MDDDERKDAALDGRIEKLFSHATWDDPVLEDEEDDD